MDDVVDTHDEVKSVQTYCVDENSSLDNNNIGVEESHNNVGDDEIINEEAYIEDDEEIAENEVMVQELESAVLPTRSLRPRNTIDYKALHSKGKPSLHQLGIITDDKDSFRFQEMFKTVNGIIMTNMKAGDEFSHVSVSEGIKRFGDQAIGAVIKEYAQLGDQNTFKMIPKEDLTPEVKRNALELLTLVTKKRTGAIKGRACANGSRQRAYIKKEDITSPTVQLESIILSLVIDGKENRDVATSDIKGAYLFAPMEDFVLVKLKGDALDIMCKLNKHYRKHVIMERGKPMLFMQLNKALYGCMQSAFLWYNTLRDTLKMQGFKLNPYDPCVANATI